MRTLLIIGSILAGAILGGVLGFFGLYWVCELMDKAEGNGPGYVTIGWMLAVFTVPLGALSGAVIAPLFAALIPLPGRKRDQPKISPPPLPKGE
jgi:hypothetical protein